MMAGLGDGAPADGTGTDGGPARHVPVLLDEVLAALNPAGNQTFLDGTFGAGGYSRALLDRGARVIGLDRDPSAIDAGAGLASAFDGRLTLHHACFSQLRDFVPEEGLDGIVLDIGVSSMQIDEAERGFSFQKDGPLDMRMSGEGVSAADVVNTLKVSDLARIFGFLGEERLAGRIARAIEKKRQDTPLRTTRDLAGLIEAVAPRKARDRIHPATRVFQALRAYVNDELGELARALLASEQALRPGGRLVVVTFHSLEDRIVKRFLAARSGKAGGSRHLPVADGAPATFVAVGRPVVAASEAEAARNPRARSAKLRAAMRTEAPSGRADLSAFGLPSLIDLSTIKGR